MCATAGGRRRDDVRLALHVEMDVCFVPLRNAYSERCVYVGVPGRGGAARVSFGEPKAKDYQKDAEGAEKTGREILRFAQTDDARCIVRAAESARLQFSVRCLISMR